MQEALPESKVRLMSPLVLAYVGDAAYEVYVRTRFAMSGESPQRLHARCVRWVSAVGQERVLAAIEDDLTPGESDVARRGRNAKTTLPQKVDAAVYRRSTSLEALIGYLYLTGDEARIHALLSQAFDKIEPGTI